MCIRDSTMASRQCGVHPLALVGHNHTPSQNPAIYFYYAPFFSPLSNSHYSPPGIPLLTQQIFLLSPIRSIPRTLTSIHPLNQPTIIHPFHITKPSQCTFICSLIYSFLHSTQTL